MITKKIKSVFKWTLIAYLFLWFPIQFFGANDNYGKGPIGKLYKAISHSTEFYSLFHQEAEGLLQRLTNVGVSRKSIINWVEHYGLEYGFDGVDYLGGAYNKNWWDKNGHLLTNKKDATLQVILHKRDIFLLVSTKVYITISFDSNGDTIKMSKSERWQQNFLADF